MNLIALTALAALCGTALSWQDSPETAAPEPAEVVPEKAPETPADPAAIDELIESRLTAYREWLTGTDRQVVMNTVSAKSNELLEGLDIAVLDAMQIERLLPLILSGGKLVPQTQARLDSLRDDLSVQGLLATTAGATLRAYGAQERPDAATIEGIVTHPKLAEAVRSGHVLTPFIALGIAEPESLAPHAASLVALSAEIDGATLDAEQAQALARYWTMIVSVVPAEEEGTLATVRTRVADALRSVASRQSDPALVSSLKDQVAQIDGAFARGELLDHPAPEVEFLWASEGAGISSLADLRGKVVVLDFWATWCEPCVRSFPNVAELAAHYQGYPVAVVGITSPQGRHHAADGSRVMTGDDRQREFDLMAEYITAKNISWPIVFGEHASWTEFGVRGIPHIAIIDTNGVVRHRGIHPFETLAEKTTKIDALLREAGLATPGG